MKQIIASIVLLLGSSALAQSFDSREIVIQDVKYLGNGCPKNSVDHYLSADGKAFTLTFDRYIADLDEAIGGMLAIKTCSLRVELLVPSGWKFAVFGVDFRGYVDLDEKVEAIHSSDFHIQGGRLTPIGRMEMKGPKSENYLKSSNIDLNNAPWSPCGRDRARNLVINSRLYVVNKNIGIRARNQGGAKGVLTMDTIDGEVMERYQIAWKKC